MKLMKKIAIISMVMMMTFAIAACGGSEDLSEYAGKWESVNVQIDGADYGDILSFSVMLEGDGSGEMDYDGDVFDVDWEVSSGVVMIDDGVDVAEGVVEGNTMTLDIGEGVIFVLEKM